MVYLYACDKARNRWFTVDCETGKTENLSYGELRDTLRIRPISNIMLQCGKVSGRNYSLERICNNIQNGRVYVCEKHVSNGHVEGYKVIHSNGKVHTYDPDTANDIFKRFGVVNSRGNYDSDGHIVIKENTYSTIDVTNKLSLIKYDTEDYYRLFKRYKKYGLSQNKAMVQKYKPVFGVYWSEETTYMESDTTSFVKNHKLLVSILSTKVECLEARPVYEELQFWNDGTGVRVRGERLLGYLVTYNVNGLIMRWIIDKEDKKLLVMLDKTKIGKLSFQSIRDLLLYTQDEWSDYGREFEDFNKKELNGFYHTVKENKVSLTLEFGKYSNKDLGVWLPLKDNVKINRMENILVYNKLYLR